MRGLFPQPEPGDRWKWAALAVIGFAVLGVLRSRDVRPVVYLVGGAVGLVLLVVVIAGLVRLTR